MQTISTFGFESRLVLLKIGYDLRGTLRDTAESSIPAEMTSRAERIADSEPTRGDIRWLPTVVDGLGDSPLM